MSLSLVYFKQVFEGDRTELHVSVETDKHYSKISWMEIPADTVELFAFPADAVIFHEVSWLSTANIEAILPYVEGLHSFSSSALDKYLRHPLVSTP